jgi:hypothetical protein
VRYLERAFQRHGCEAITEALKKAGVDSGNVAFVGQFLVDLRESKLVPERPERNCAVCGQVTENGPLDRPNPRTNAVYCSEKCRQKAYRQRQAAPYGKNERTNVTKVENVTEALLQTLPNRNSGNRASPANFSSPQLAKPRAMRPVMTGPVCAWCDVYNRVERVTRDAEGNEIMRDTCCAYCGRTELRFGGKSGRQTPIPPPPPPCNDDDGVPF